MLAARPAKRRSVSDSDVIVVCTAFYTASQLVSICMRCVYFATIGQSFDWREPIGLQERLEGRSSHNGEFSVMSRSRSQGTEVTIVTGDVPSRAFTRHHGEFSVMGTIFNPAVREATSSLYKLHSSEDRTHTQFPQIATLEGGLAADRWR